MVFDNRLLTFMNQMADEAGAIARRYFRMSFSVVTKQDASPVTIADKEIERTLRAMIEREFPEHGIIGEEEGNIRPDAEYQWVIDPIDGTRSFISGMLTFTTLIALTKNSVPIAGIINQPITNERWFGAQGEVSLLNHIPILAKLNNKLSAANISTTSYYHFSAVQSAGFEMLRKSCANVTLGGDAYTYALLASGHIDIVVDVSMKSYDYSALVPVIEGAGGIITDWQGKKLDLHSDGTVLACANQSLHTQALAILTADKA